MKNKFTCCICKKDFIGFGNSPYPLCHKDDYDSKCCDNCNLNYVTPARMDMAINRNTEEQVQEKYLGKVVEKC